MLVQSNFTQTTDENTQNCHIVLMKNRSHIVMHTPTPLETTWWSWLPRLGTSPQGRPKMTNSNFLKSQSLTMSLSLSQQIRCMSYNRKRLSRMRLHHNLTSHILVAQRIRRSWPCMRTTWENTYGWEM